MATVGRAVIVYSLDASDLSRRNQLITLADRLNAEGVDTEIDLYHAVPESGWPRWMEEVVSDRVILTVCTKQYHDRFQGINLEGQGGAGYEATLVRNRLMAGKGQSDFVVAVLLEPNDRRYVPDLLKGQSVFDVSNDEDYEALYAFLTGRELHEKPPLGEVRGLREVRTGGVVESPQVTAEDSARRAEIAVSLERLLSSMRRTFIRGQFTLGEWQALHNDLDDRVRNRGASALRERYGPFCKALDYDQFSINYQTGLSESFGQKKAQAAEKWEALRERETRRHDAFAMQNIATDVLGLAPFLRDFDNRELADRLEYLSRVNLEIAERDLQEPP